MLAQLGCFASKWSAPTYYRTYLWTELRLTHLIFLQTISLGPFCSLDELLSNLAPTAQIKVLLCIILPLV
mgnify:CR=1 FL=1